MSRKAEAFVDKIYNENANEYVEVAWVWDNNTDQQIPVGPREDDECACEGCKLAWDYCICDGGPR